MSREEILKMDDIELFQHLFSFVHGTSEGGFAAGTLDNPRDQLWWCYQAEEKIKEMGRERICARNLMFVVPGAGVNRIGIWNMAHASPKDRARAILMTRGGR